MGEGEPQAPEASSSSNGGGSGDMREYCGNGTANTRSDSGCGCAPVLADSPMSAPGELPVAPTSVGPDPSSITTVPEPSVNQQQQQRVNPQGITVSISPTTGGQFELTVDKNETIENLKKMISKKLKVSKERICLLYRESQLREGTLEENRLQDGSRLTLLPSVETGLLRPARYRALRSSSSRRRRRRGSTCITAHLLSVQPDSALAQEAARTGGGAQLQRIVTQPVLLSLQAQRPEQSVMQALESLSDSQVNDFLSGRAPLNLTMRLGDHMMLIQLQLSTVTPGLGNQAAAAAAAAAASTSTSGQQQPSAPAPTKPTSPSLATGNGTLGVTVPGVNPESAGAPMDHTAAVSQQLTSALANGLTAASLESCYFRKPNPPGASSAPVPTPKTTSSGCAASGCSSAGNPCCLATPQEPRTSTPPAPQQHREQSARNFRHLQSGRYPYLNSHHLHHHRLARKSGQVVQGGASKSSCPSCNEAETSTAAPASTASDSASGKSSKFSLFLGKCNCSKSPKKKPCIGLSTIREDSVADLTALSLASSSESVSPASSMPTTPTSPNCPDVTSVDPASAANGPSATLDTRALAEASRNLTQKLKALSSEEHAKRHQGAIIESMRHHGKGVYTGTFSGTLNPALQDRNGRPKRDISTIIHILNDLLCATPATTSNYYRYQQRQQNAHRATSTSANIASATNTSSASTASHGPVTTKPVGASGQSATTCMVCAGLPDEELSKENETTKGKLRRLRLVMEQRREKMRARRQARAAPYTTNWAAVTPDPDTNGSGSSKSSSDLKSEPELQPCSPEPVVA